jgi:hypothetical protein
MQGRTLMNHDGTQFYCWKHDRWFAAIKMVQCYYRKCKWLYEHMAPHRRQERRAKVAQKGPQAGKPVLPGGRHAAGRVA